ncbi:MAG: GIY-YIG nuclease family protein [Rhizobiaceae bacterium]|nr:GIY-YIG nuclease family protein [Rhizobiaceae bacterium]
MADLSDQELLDALGVSAKPKKQVTHSAKEERLLAGFEEIQRFVETHNSMPEHGEDRDIFERLYAVRLDKLRGLAEARELLADVDHQGLLTGEMPVVKATKEPVSDEELLAELGVASQASDITELKHVKSRAEIRAAEDIDSRKRCEDFETFKPMFDLVQQEISNGIRETRPFKDDASIQQNDWFILAGQKVYVAEAEPIFVADYGRTDRRLRAVFDNGTESNILMRSLERALQKDETGRRITDPNAGPLFSNEKEDGDAASGTIYILRSKSQHPTVAKNRDVLHKIGVTRTSVKSRIANAKNDPTYLMADVEIVRTYELFNISRAKLESLIHRVFEPARLEIEIKDRFGKPITPREWFLVPLFVIDEAVERIQDGTISNYIYDPQVASLKRVG